MELKKSATGAILDDSAIIELYWQRDEDAILHTDIKYRRVLMTVAYNIVHDKRDCEECLNDTYMGAWKTIPPTRPNALRAFLTTVMRRVAVNRYTRNIRKSVVPSEMTVSFSELEDITSGTSVESEFDSVLFGKALSDFLRTLSKRRRFIFMSRYYVCNTVDKIADDLNLSRSTVNKELAFIRKELKEKLESEGLFL